MPKTPKILSAEQMETWYGSFYERSPKLHLDRGNVPTQFWPLLPYAEFWGIADDWTREGLVKHAPVDVQQNLKQVVAAFDVALDEWLAGPEADNPNPSDGHGSGLRLTRSCHRQEHRRNDSRALDRRGVNSWQSRGPWRCRAGATEGREKMQPLFRRKL
jgi:hypothetical protein